jgi:hypothetical protein
MTNKRSISLEYSSEKNIELHIKDENHWADNCIRTGTTTLSEDELYDFLNKTENASFGFFTVKVKEFKGIYLMAIINEDVYRRLKLLNLILSALAMSKKREPNLQILPGFNAERSILHDSNHSILTTHRQVGKERGEIIIPQLCREGVCGSCAKHDAWEDDYGPSSAGCWKKCCGFEGRFTEWKRCREAECERERPCIYWCNRPVQADCRSREFCSKCHLAGGTCCRSIGGDLIECTTS